MKIALITEYLEPQINGIAIRYSEIAKNLKKQGHNVHVYGPKNCPDSDFILPTIKNYWNIHNRIALPNFEIIKNIITEKYDAIYIVLPPLFWYPIISLIGKSIGTKVIVSNHVYLNSYNKSYTKNETIQKTFYFLGILYYKLQNILCDIIVAPSKYDDIKFINKEKFNISLNGINHDKFPFKQKEKQNKEILYVARIAPEKNLDKLFTLFKTLTGYKLTVIGDGPSLKSFKEQYKDDNSINFLGFIEHPELWKYFQKADFHLVTSLSETFCLTVVESMATGTPVIFPLCDTFETLYGEEFPELMYDINNQETFKRSINFLENNFINLSKKSYEFSKKFDWSEITRDLVKLIQKY